MSSQAPSQPSSNPAPSAARLEIDALQRRRALLSGLGKGSAAIAALSPMASQASGQHVLANPGLPNGMGYCTVSGFQSAAISGLPRNGYTTCSAFAPSHFVVGSKVGYVLKNEDGKVKETETATSLGIAKTQFATLSANNNTGEIRLIPTNDSTNYVIYKGNGASDQKSCTKTTLTNLPDAALKKVLFRSVFTTSTNTTARFLDLFVPLSAASLSDDAFYAAAYLSARNDLQGQDQGDIPFDASYVVSLYGHSGAAAFFRALCTKA